MTRMRLIHDQEEFRVMIEGMDEDGNGEIDFFGTIVFLPNKFSNLYFACRIFKLIAQHQ